jgi:CubicO group peptidase (beta-lactamase class C family)
MTVTVAGRAARPADFPTLRAAFADSLTGAGGAGLCVYQDGELALDLWGGVARPATGMPWERDTLVCMMSVGKSMAALSALILVDRGQIELDAPVARYWPAFAQAGKQAISVRSLLSGMAALLYADAAPDRAGLDWEVMADALAQQAPSWQPDTHGAYHSLSYGFLVGELVRQVDGRSIDRFFAEEVAGPLGAEYAFGLTDEQIARTADIIPNQASNTLALMADPTSTLGRAWRVLPDLQAFASSEPFRRGVFPTANGHGNARSMARIYAMLACGGELDGVRLLSRETVEVARTEVWSGDCGMTGRNYRYGLGFFLSRWPLAPFGDNPRAFGHTGVGGSMAFADPEASLAFSYSANAMCEGAGVGQRGEALITALIADLRNTGL